MKTAVIYDKWLSNLGGGEVVACNMATILRDSGYKVVFACQNKVSIEVIKEKLSIDMSGVKFTEVSNEHDLQLLSTLDPQPSTIDLFINLSFMDYTYGFAKKNIYYVHFPTPIRSIIFNYVLLFFQKTNLHFLFPPFSKEKINDRLRAGVYFDIQKRLDSYDLFTTHSKYVSKWTKIYWNNDVQILYPPIKLLTTDDYRLTTKKNWICSVGRFFTLAHSKKQEVMIEAFKKLYDSMKVESRKLKVENTGQKSNNQQPSTLDPRPFEKTQGKPTTNDLQLHLIGGVGAEPSTVRFIDKLKQLAKDYPIFFHFNATRGEVENILLKSKIYWHATGFGEDPEKAPIKFEHFGIAPLEAISAGCVPILYNGGGLPEIIQILELNPKLHLFSSTEELINQTVNFLSDNSMRKIPQCNLKFSAKTFKQTFLQILKTL